MHTSTSSESNQSGRPDFLIAGGMKCGTSTLHRSLSNHPDVQMLDGEQYLLDFDDRTEHPDFPPPPPSLSHEKHVLQYIRTAYNTLVDPARITGDRSTTYLYSRKTPERLEQLFPNIKLLSCYEIPLPARTLITGITFALEKQHARLTTVSGRRTPPFFEEETTADVLPDTKPLSQTTSFISLCLNVLSNKRNWF